MHLEKFECRFVWHERLDAIEHGVDRPVAFAFFDGRATVDVKLHGGALWPSRASYDRQREELDAILRRRNFLVDQRLDVLVIDMLLAVGEGLEANKRVFELIAREFVAKIPKLVHERVTTRVLTHHQRSLLHSDTFR